MVFVAVGDENAPDPVGPLHQIGNIGDNQVNTQHFFGGKLNPAINDDYIVAELQGHHIFPDFAEAAQWYNTQVLVQIKVNS
jgi:hypothetical protein